MTAHELSDKLTRLTIPALQNALLLRWETLGVPVLRSAIELKIAHVCVETGLKSCHNWNIGNTKHRDGNGRCWQLFECGEEIGTVTLRQVESLCPGSVTVRANYVREGQAWCSIWLTPPHPWCRFEAFETLTEGIESQLGYLRRHPQVLAALQTGDPAAYNRELRAAGYYTASPEVYLSGLQRELATVRRACAELDWGDVA
jgi:hypothetical protein